MVYFIKNDFMRVGIDKLGAEIVSIATLGEEIEKEYIWQGDEKYWMGHAPVMFPICGRLYNGEYTYLGKTYTLPNHGFARKSEFT